MLFFYPTVQIFSTAQYELTLDFDNLLDLPLDVDRNYLKPYWRFNLRIVCSKLGRKISPGRYEGINYTLHVEFLIC